MPVDTWVWQSTHCREAAGVATAARAWPGSARRRDDLQPLHRHERQQEQQPQAADDPAFLIECHTVILNAPRALPTG